MDEPPGLYRVIFSFLLLYNFGEVLSDDVTARFLVTFQSVRAQLSVSQGKEDNGLKTLETTEASARSYMLQLLT